MSVYSEIKQVCVPWNKLRLCTADEVNYVSVQWVKFCPWTVRWMMSVYSEVNYVCVQMFNFEYGSTCSHSLNLSLKSRSDVKRWLVHWYARVFKPRYEVESLWKIHCVPLFWLMGSRKKTNITPHVKYVWTTLFQEYFLWLDVEERLTVPMTARPEYLTIKNKKRVCANRLENIRKKDFL